MFANANVRVFLKTLTETLMGGSNNSEIGICALSEVYF